MMFVGVIGCNYVGFSQKMHYQVMNLKKIQCTYHVMMTVEIRKFAYSNSKGFPCPNRQK
jgi:hypothetical protein